MRSTLLALVLVAAPTLAEAAPLNPVRSAFTLVGAFAGGGAGLLVGTTAYGLTDPYGHDNSGEWLLAGGIGGFGVGAALGGGLTHALVGGRAGGRVVLWCGLMGLVGGAAAIYAPTYYTEGELADEAVWLLVGAAAVNVVAVPLTAMGISAFLGGRSASDVAVAPWMDADARGLSLVVRL